MTMIFLICQIIFHLVLLHADPGFFPRAARPVRVSNQEIVGKKKPAWAAGSILQYAWDSGGYDTSSGGEGFEPPGARAPAVFKTRRLRPLGLPPLPRPSVSQAHPFPKTQSGLRQASKPAAPGSPRRPDVREDAGYHPDPVSMAFWPVRPGSSISAWSPGRRLSPDLPSPSSNTLVDDDDENRITEKAPKRRIAP